nr:hypothetical protein SFHH103_04514 [Sinorhizobium fredii HH103]
MLLGNPQYQHIDRQIGMWRYNDTGSDAGKFLSHPLLD